MLTAKQKADARARIQEEGGTSRGEWAALQSLDEMERERDTYKEMAREQANAVEKFCAECRELVKIAERERDEYKWIAEEQHAIFVEMNALKSRTVDAVQLLATIPTLTKERDEWKARAEKAEAHLAVDEKLITARDAFIVTLSGIVGSCAEHGAGCMPHIEYEVKQLKGIRPAIAAQLRAWGRGEIGNMCDDLDSDATTALERAAAAVEATDP